MVLHFHPATAVWHGDGPQHKHTVRTHMVGGVAQQVVQHPFHHGGVGAYHAFLVGFQLQRPAILLAHGVIAARDLKAKLAHVKINRVKLFCTAGNFAQLHHAVYQRAQAVSFVHNNAALFGALGLVIAGNIAHRFGIALNQGQRGAQVMADISQDIFFQLCGAFDFLRHVVELPPQQAQLIIADYRHLNIIVAVGNLAGTLRKLAHRAGEPPAEQRRHQQVERNQKDGNRNQHTAHDLGGCFNLCQAGGYDHTVTAVFGQAAHQHLPVAAGFNNFVQRTLIVQGMAGQDGGSGVWGIYRHVIAESGHAVV